MISRNPLISVIMPAYNAEKTIIRAVSSVLSQTCQDFELIIVNDGSTDETLSVCQSIQDNRVLIISQENMGLSGARNTGLCNCKGEYVCFVDSDDEIEPMFLEVLHNSILQNNTDIAICGMKGISQDHEIIDSLSAYEGVYFNPLKNPNFLRLLETGLFNSVCNKIYCKKLIDSIGARFEKIILVEDILFNLNIYSKIESLSIVAEPLYKYHHEDSVLTRAVKPGMFESYFRVHKYLLSLVKKDYFPYIHCFVYHQYFSIFDKYMHSILNGFAPKTNVLAFLKVYMNNELVKEAFNYYKPIGYKNRIVHTVVKRGWYNLYLTYLTIKKM